MQHIQWNIILSSTSHPHLGTVPFITSFNINEQLTYHTVDTYITFPLTFLMLKPLNCRKWTLKKRWWCVRSIQIYRWMLTNKKKSLTQGCRILYKCIETIGKREELLVNAEINERSSCHTNTQPDTLHKHDWCVHCLVDCTQWVQRMFEGKKP